MLHLLRPRSTRTAQPRGGWSAALWCLLVCTCLLTARTASAQTTQPAAPAPLPDPQSYNGGPQELMFTPNSYLSGWATGVAEDDGSGGLKSWKPYANPDAPTTTELSKNVAKAFYSINFVWVLVAGFLVMFMQAGFALVETGLCRGKNAAHTMWMNFMVYPLGMFGFFVCGFMFLSSGANSTAIGAPGPLGTLVNSVGTDTMFKVGEKGWGLFGMDPGFIFLGKKAYDGAALVLFLFMMVFMDTTATIPTGALAERWASKSFIIFSLCIGAFIYPIYGCWVWGGGWLAQLGVNAGLGHGFVDYAGSSVVHLQGGALALVTSFLLGPRIGKYGADGKARAIPGHHIPMVLLGTFILAFGWFGFNAGSSLAGTDGRIGVTAVNTMIAGTGGALVIAFICVFLTGKFDPTMAANGMLAGLVAITAPCAFVAPWAAFTIGAIAGGLVYGSVWFVENVLKLDDPVGAISVHGVCGAFGVLCVGIFSDGTYGAGWNAVGYNAYAAGSVPAGQAVTIPGVTGILYGDAGQLTAQAIGVVACTLWNVVVGGIVFFIIGKIVGNRVPAAVEIAGLDLPEVGVAGYPEFMDHITPDQVSASEVAAAKAALAK
jgi:Amt family ammonium transporter